MKAICILLQNYYDDDVRVRRKAEALVMAGYAVDVIALQSERTPYRTYELKGVNVYTMPLGKKRGSIFRYLFEYGAFFLFAFWKLRRLMKKRQYAIIDVNNLPDFLVFAAVWAKHKGAKVVFDMHEITPEFYMSKYGVEENSQLIRLLKYVEKKSMLFSDHVITINEPVRQLLAGRGLELARCTVITNSVDETLFAPARDQSTSPDKDFEPKAFVMMYHGTLTGLYGLDIAIKAFGRVKDQIAGAEFWIFGRGPDQTMLEKLALELGLASRVKFFGMVAPDEIPNWLARCDVGLLATRRDVFLDLSFSNKLPEYVIMNKAVICSRLKTIQHYFSEDALAYFEPMDAEDLGRQMIRVYGDAQLRARLAQKASAEYHNICWAIMKARYLQLMATLLAEKDLATPTRPMLSVAPG